MKKILRVITGALLIMLSTAGIGLAEAVVPDAVVPTDVPVPAAVTIPEAQSLSLAQALAIALKENHQVELSALGVEKAQISLDQALFAREKMLNALDKSDSSPDQDASLVIDVLPVQAQSGKIIADTARTYTLSSIQFGVESGYYAVLRAQKLLETVQNSYKRADVQYQQAQAKFKVGVSPKIDVIAAEAQRKSAAADVNSATADLAIAKMRFNQTLGLELDTPLTLTDKFTFLPAAVMDLPLVIADQQIRDLPFVTAKENFNINQVNFDYYHKYFTTNTFLYRDAAYQFKQAEVNFNTAKSTLELNIKTANLNLQTAEDNYNTLTKSLAQAREAYRLTKLRFDVGMATNYDVLTSEDALNQVELGLVNALYNFNLAKAQFNYGIFAASSQAGM